MKLRALDLFCGLFEPKFRLRTDTAIKKFVTGGTEYPDHVALRVRHCFPCAIALVLRLVGDLKDAGLPTCFAGCRDIGMAAFQSVDNSVAEFFLSGRTISFFFLGISTHPSSDFFSCRLPGALGTTIPLIRSWRSDVKMRSAPWAVCTLFRDVGLFKTA